jgi:hypothetical protein
MNTIKIDIRRYATAGQSAPTDEQFGYWTVTLAGHPVSVFSTYSEAETVAQVYTRLNELGQNTLILEKA